MAVAPPHRRRIVGFVAVAAIGILLLAGCRPEPDPTPTKSASATPTPSAATPTPTPTATTGPDDIALPDDCAAIYSSTMMATLESSVPPLNDPGVTMGSSQIVDALELLDSGIPTIRCSWGLPSEFGLATNVSLVAPESAQQLAATLQGVGFGCDAVQGGTLCSLDRTTIDLDDNQVALGETHFFRGNAWISTAWIGGIPDGYTEDVAATLWG